MTATKEARKEAKTGRKKGSRPTADHEAEPAPAQAAAAKPDLRTEPRRPPKVKGAAAACRILSIADRSESLDTRRRLRRLARQIADGPRSARGLGFIETALGECAEAAAQSSSTRDPWLLREAAAWGLAWLTRSRRAGGSAGRLLEQFVAEARVAQTALADRDTNPAAFVITLARLFCDVESCRDVESAATAALEEEIARLVSEDGSVGLAGSPAIVERVGRWAVCHAVGIETGCLPWSDAIEKRFRGSLATALRLLGGRGRMLVGHGRMPAVLTAPIIDAALGCRGERRLRRTAKAVASGRTGTAARVAKPANSPLLPREHDDPSSAVAILRSGWEPDSLRVLVEYRDAIPRLEVALGDRLLVDGPWQWGVTCDGERLQAEGPWASTCLESNRRATYFEITAPLPGGLQIERSVTILTRDRVVVMGDAITRRVAGAGGRLQFTSTLPVGVGLEVDPAVETREAFLYDTMMRCLAMPLGLPEWRSAGRGGFEATAEGLTLTQEGQGRLFAPVWLDCDPRRLGGQLTWRQLTVADTRVILPPSMAAGHRVQVGLDQWLLYRSLDEPRNRTLLGCNVSCGFVVGRVANSGVVRRAIEIA